MYSPRELPRQTRALIDLHLEDLLSASPANALQHISLKCPVLTLNLWDHWQGRPCGRLNATTSFHIGADPQLYPLGMYLQIPYNDKESRL